MTQNASGSSAILQAEELRQRLGDVERAPGAVWPRSITCVSTCFPPNRCRFRAARQDGMRTPAVAGPITTPHALFCCFLDGV